MIRFDPRRNRRSATALVLVLSFLVLLTGMIIAFLSRTINNRQLSDSSFNTAKADELARASLNVVIGDLKQEISAGSDAKVENNVTVYVPSNAAAMLPVRNGPLVNGAEAIPNLIRVSSPNALSAPGVQHAASASSSVDVSANGRSIPLRAWNTHYLIPRATGAVAGDTTPISQFTAPSWVYVTNQGPQAIISPAASTIGRYAYSIYDEGGLVDLNVAGYPSNTDALQIGRKGVTAFADLTPLSAALTKTKVDNIVGWRNYATAQPAGTFGNFTFDAQAASRFVKFATSPGTDFRQVSATQLNGRTDQNFLARQQLIKLAKGLDSGDTLDWLQYVSTFSREKNAPSWKPAYDASERGGSATEYKYKSNADDAANPPVNRDLATARFKSDCTFTSYSLDFTPTTRSAKAGDPLISRRFPLPRLGWLLTQGPAAGNPAAAAAIKCHFGLMWQPASATESAHWVYTSPDGTGSAPVLIKTLNQVASLQREPDFMELLKAVILEGSLGKTAGNPNFPQISASTPDTDYRTAHVDVTEDIQIIRIAANIIDQYDADSFPTAIKIATEQGAEGGSITVHGIENLPYINRMFDLAYRPNDGSKRGKLCSWYEFEMWNPHQLSINSGVDVPTSFRITASSGAPYTQVSLTHGMTLPKSAQANFLPGSTFINFNASVGSFTEPTLLTGPTPANPNPPGLATCDQPPSSFASGDMTPLRGLFVGYVDVTDVPDSEFNPDPTDPTKYASAGSIPQDSTFELQYSDGNGGWVTYQQLIHLIKPNRSGTATAFKSVSTNHGGFYYRTDPRNTRFGGGKGAGPAPGQTMRGADPLSYTRYQEGKSEGDAPLSTNPGWKLYTSTSIRMPALMNNDASASSSYTDPDGVLRLGDSGIRDGGALPNASDSAGNSYTPGNSTARPIVLNRAFRSIAELGYVFRDQPWKTLDLFSKNSADAGLMDVFCIEDNAAVAGKVNLNTRQLLVLKTLLINANRTENGATTITDASADAIAKDIVAATKLSPLMSRADLVTSLGYSTFSATSVNGNYPQFKTQREAYVRGLVDSGSTRTWNMLIDVVAQAGKFPLGASNLSGFVVEGERHCWLHVAIDRFTGEVIDQNLETVYE